MPNKFGGQWTVIGRLLDGSTKIALDTKGFDHYVFVEQDMHHVHNLKRVCVA